ncbi:SMAD/FHA domain-containing protein, partial [Haematococcus lacustris]
MNIGLGSIKRNLVDQFACYPGQRSQTSRHNERAKHLRTRASEMGECSHLPFSIAFDVTDGPCAGQVFTPKAYHITVGRTRISKLHIKDTAVSERHAEVCWTGKHWALLDLGSSNGTLHNGKSLTPLEHCIALQDGDVIKFGTDTVCKVQIQPLDASQLTIEQLLQAQHELLAQGVQAQALEAAAMMLAQLQSVQTQLAQSGVKQT